MSGLSSAITGLGTTVIGGAAVFSVLPVALAVGLGGAALMVISKNVKVAFQGSVNPPPSGGRV